MLNHVLPFNYQQLYIQPSVVEEKKEEVLQAPRESYAEAPKTKVPVTKSSLQEIEREAILQALIDNHGIQTKAATQLGMSARQIGYKIKKYNLDF
jgi:Nif-specific regulatory protein